MSKVESLILGMFFGFLPVLLCVAAAGFVNVIFLEEKGIAYWALAGLVVGLIIDCLFVKSCITKAYQMNSKIFIALYLFYSVFVLGMCMGVPILNFALGIVAGVYIARRMHFATADEQTRKQAFKKTAVFCSAAMVMVCCLITFWGAIGGMIGSTFEAPYLSFTFTAPVYFAIAVVGGAFLVLLQYWLTSIAARITFKLWR